MQKIELFKDGNIFERIVEVPSTDFEMIGELGDTLNFEIMAKFQVTEDADGMKFKNLGKYWIEYSGKTESEIEGQRFPVQNIASSHSP